MAGRDEAARRRGKNRAPSAEAERLLGGAPPGRCSAPFPLSEPAPCGTAPTRSRTCSPTTSSRSPARPRRPRPQSCVRPRQPVAGGRGRGGEVGVGRGGRGVRGLSTCSNGPPSAVKRAEQASPHASGKRARVRLRAAKRRRAGAATVARGGTAAAARRPRGRGQTGLLGRSRACLRVRARAIRACAGKA